VFDCNGRNVWDDRLVKQIAGYATEEVAVRGVKHGEERLPVSPALLRHLPAEGVWVFDHKGGQFVVAGGPTARIPPGSMWLGSSPPGSTSS
jgi:hypothetical protein